MSDILDELDDQTLPPIKDKELFLSIWTEPRRTIRQLLSTSPRKYVDLLLILGGIANSIDNVLENDRLSTDSLPLLIFIAFTVGGVIGWVFYYFAAWLLSAIGNWLDGKGTSAQFRTVIAWSLIPSIASMIIVLIGLMLSGGDIYTEMDILSGEYVVSPIALILFIIQAVTSIWTFVILVIGVSELQDFSIGRALGNILLPIAFLLIPVLLLVLLNNLTT